MKSIGGNNINNSYGSNLKGKPTPSFSSIKTPKTPEDKVELGGGKSPARKVLEKTAGFVTGSLPAVITGVSGFVSGGVAAVSNNEDTAKSTHNFTATALISAIGITAGMFLIGGAPGFLLGCMAGPGVGIDLYEKDVHAKAAGEVFNKATDAVSDNVPTESKFKDGVRDFTEGSIRGGLKGALTGFRAGQQIGEGLVSGFIDGIKGAF